MLQQKKYHSNDRLLVLVVVVANTGWLIHGNRARYSIVNRRHRLAGASYLDKSRPFGMH